jgi:hypothetical protein
MSFRLFGAIALFSSVTCLPASIAASPPKLSCAIQKSVYRAIGKTDYKLTFDQPLSELAGVSQAIANLEHSKRGKIATFVLSQSNGYGKFSLSEPKSEETSHTTVFFDATLKEVRNLNKAPIYLQISGLGSDDWYSSDRKGNRDYPLGDVMWKLSTCRK